MGSSINTKTNKTRIILPEADLQNRTYAWHAHDVREVLKALGVGEQGLGTQEVKARLVSHGRNEFTKSRPPSVLRRFISQLASPLPLVLIIALILTTVLGEYLDALVIAIALLLSIVVSFWQEGKASEAFTLLSQAQPLHATVVRDGERHEVLASTLVPGDIVELQDGVQVPADMRLITVKKLSINEATLTGEWLPANKATAPLPIGTSVAQQGNMAFKGTFVSTGYGIGVVVATGDDTIVGGIAHDVQGVHSADTPLQTEMERLSHALLVLVAILIVIVFSLGLTFGHSVYHMTLLSIAIAVSAIPEGLPAAVSIVLAISMRTLLRKGGLVRNGLAAETLGSTTFILTDKTGTLTEAKMHVTGILTVNALNLDESSWSSNTLLRDLVDTALCATDAYIDTTGGKHILRGETTERAIVRASTVFGISTEHNSYRAERVDYLPFASEQQFAAGLAERNGSYRVCLTGAPEKVLSHSTHIVTTQGVIALSEQYSERIQEQMRLLTAEGKRLIAVAYKETMEQSLPTEQVNGVLAGNIFAGILVCSDPIRKDAKEAVTKIKAAGVTVVLVTGDNPETALAIARATGITGPHEGALTGDDIMSLTDNELREVLTHVRVFARVLPRQKMRLVEVLEQSGEIVAMTGDGVNDAAALQRANIGIALGSGTHVAQESADIVLTNDSFMTMYAAIEEGRRIVSNLRKIVGYVLSTSLSEIVVITAAIASGSVIPLTTAQILWANIIEGGLMSAVFAFEKGEKGAMKRRPQDIYEEGILSKDMIGFLAMVVGIAGALTVSLYFYLVRSGASASEVTSAMFLIVSIQAIFMSFAFRSLSVPIWKIPFLENKYFIAAFLCNITLLFGALSIPFMQTVLSYEPLPGITFVLVILCAFTSFVMVEVSKWVFFERRK